MLKSLKRKFVIVNVSIIFFITTITFIILHGVFYIACESSSLSNMRYYLTNTQNLNNYKDSSKDPKPDKFLAFPYRFEGFLIEVNKDGTIIGNTSNILISSEIINEILQSQKRDIIDINNSSYRYLKNISSDTIKIVFYDRSNEIEYLDKIAFLLIIIEIITILVLSFFSIIISNWITKPAKDSLNKQKQFISDASHELKTPITVILSNLELILSSNSIDKKNVKWIENIKSESIRMKKLTQELLDLSRLDEKVKLNETTINISDLLENIVLTFEAICYEENKTFNFINTPNILINADENQITRLFYILIDNAVKYCDNSGEIRVCLSINKKTILITISNTYSGEPFDTNKIMERFYKGDISRTDINSFGLGLSLAQRICNYYKYKINCNLNNNKVIFHLKLK